MAEVASAYVTLIPSAKGFARGIQGQISGDMTRVGHGAGVAAATGMKGGVASMATRVFAPLAAAAAALKLGDILGDAVAAGSQFEQAVGGADAVFKKDAASIKKSADEAAMALGLSRTEYLELATVLGSQLKNKGIKNYAGSTEDLIGLGADLAAQFGGSTADAVASLSSLMRGEFDPIEKYGVSIKQSDINARLAAKGMDKLEGSAKKQAETQAALAILTEQTADAQGAFGRESDTYAGKQQRLAASWEDIKTQVGTALLPALTDLSDWFIREGLPAIQRFGGWVKDELWPALKDGWREIQPGLETAKKILGDTFGGKNGDALKDFGRLLTDYVIPGIATFVNVYLPVMATNWALVVQAFERGMAVFDAIVGAVRAMAAFVLGAFANITRAGADLLDALSNVPGFGWAKDAADKMRGAADQADAMRSAIERIPNSKTVSVGVNYTVRGGQFVLDNGTVVAAGVLKARAKGGPVSAGEPYLVGEKGPELIIPKRNGTVIPNHDLAKGTPIGGAAMDYRRLEDAVASGASQARPTVGIRQTEYALVQRRNAGAVR